MKNKYPKSKFPYYFHDTANKDGIRFTRAGRLGARFRNGKYKMGTFQKSQTILPLNFWLTSGYRQVTKAEFLKIKG